MLGPLSRACLPRNAAPASRTVGACGEARGQRPGLGTGCAFSTRCELRQSACWVRVRVGRSTPSLAATGAHRPPSRCRAARPPPLRAAQAPPFSPPHTASHGDMGHACACTASMHAVSELPEAHADALFTWSSATSPCARGAQGLSHGSTAILLSPAWRQYAAQCQCTVSSAAGGRSPCTYVQGAQGTG